MQLLLAVVLEMKFFFHVLCPFGSLSLINGESRVLQSLMCKSVHTFV